MKEYYFYYSDGQPHPIVRIRAKRQPGKNTIPRSGTWVVRQWICKPQRAGFFTESVCAWEMPCFPEITWGRLSKMKFVKKEPVDV